MRRLIVASIPIVLLAIAVSGSSASARPTCDGRAATKVGTNGNNVINGTSGPDVIVAKGGNDKVNGRGGRDRICGGTGRDFPLDGGGGNDRIFGGNGDDGLFGDPGNDSLFGEGGADNLFGRDGSDDLDGGGGDDLGEGNDGDDHLFGDVGDDRLLGGPGDDNLVGAAGSDDCRQQGGNGTIVDCETADLEVKLTCPDSAGPGAVFCGAGVTNHGPDDVSYVLVISHDRGGICTEPGPIFKEPVLAATFLGRTTEYTPVCQFDTPSGELKVDVTVVANADDPDQANDHDSSVIELQ